MALTAYESISDKAIREQIERQTKLFHDKGEYFVHTLAEAIAIVAASFYPRPVVVRMSNYATNEHAKLLGGHSFESVEANPMRGWPTASRYVDGFHLECEALHRVRNRMGYTNVNVMIPSCQSVKERRRVLQQMSRYGLTQHADGLAVSLIIEIPNNILLADQFAQLFDGFSSVLMTLLISRWEWATIQPRYTDSST